ncbi:TPA: response regulator [archaeon]|nr:response regulator [Candidatus Naiadarchaeales archaeon SRR2090153.bin461]HIK03060.1 response regulator [Candidatus Naiadarchaeales archaeon SRR2090159.bin1288]
MAKVKSAKKSAKAASTSKHSGADILVVDDEPVTCQLVKEILEADGNKVDVAYNGQECLNKSEKKNYDLISLDVMMPDLNGWEVFQRLKMRGEKAKIVFLSIVQITKEREEMLRSNGVADYILKPFTEEGLRSRIRSVLSK